ncbi:MAG: type II toxin-antitoxin system HicB family antitoxin [Crocosphaera sp.]
MNNLKYTMIIQWLEEDECYLVGFPDFPGQKWRTHGDTYTEAVTNEVEVLELLIEDYQMAREIFPTCKMYYNQVA